MLNSNQMCTSQLNPSISVSLYHLVFFTLNWSDWSRNLIKRSNSHTINTSNVTAFIILFLFQFKFGLYLSFGYIAFVGLHSYSFVFISAHPACDFIWDRHPLLTINMKLYLFKWGFLSLCVHCHVLLSVFSTLENNFPSTRDRKCYLSNMRKTKEVQTACLKFQSFSYTSDGAGAKPGKKKKKIGQWAAHTFSSRRLNCSNWRAGVTQMADKNKRSIMELWKKKKAIMADVGKYAHI